MDETQIEIIRCDEDPEAIARLLATSLEQGKKHRDGSIRGADVQGYRADRFRSDWRKETLYSADFFMDGDWYTLQPMRMEDEEGHLAMGVAKNIAEIEATIWNYFADSIVSNKACRRAYPLVLKEKPAE